MDDHEEQTRALLALSLCENVGSGAIFRLLDHFGSARRALAASEGELRKVPGLSPEARQGALDGPPDGACADELERLRREGVRLIPCFSEDYPRPLTHLEDGRPPLLRVRGTYLEQDELAVAVVGSRRCSHYGRKQASRLAGRLAGMGFTVVSGFARGIDTESHRGALRAGGRTVAVIGCGLSHMYPPEHAELAAQVADNGALISELPMDTPVKRRNFPPRNRLISGLSLGVVVVEASRKSGTMITAGWAAEQGKPVMAFPGDADRATSHGCHSLIRDGAILVEDARDVVEALGPLSRPVKVAAGDEGQEAAEPIDDPRALSLNDRERRILGLVRRSPRHIDALIDEVDLPASIVSSALLTLEVKGLVTKLSGSRYVRN